MPLRSDNRMIGRVDAEEDGNGRDIKMNEGGICIVA